MGEIIAKAPGIIRAVDGTPLKVDRPAPNAPSVTYDAVVIPGDQSAAAIAKQTLAIQPHRRYSTPNALHLIVEDALDSAKLDKSAPGMIAISDGNFTGALRIAMLKHRHFEREVETI